MIYLVGVDPRRARGPLGWLLLSAAAASFVIAALRAYALDPSPFRQVSPWLASAVLIPWCFGLAAILGGPVRPEVDRRPPRLPLGEVVAYAPYLVSGVVLAVLTLREREALAWPLVTFIAITGILVLRQFLLLREVRRANQGLEAKVAQRTQDLEHLQGVMVRTERMNALATLGAGLAHDLNNLLAAVRGSAELLRMDLEEGKRPSERDVARIQDATGKAGQLTQRLMAFARRESGVGRATGIDPVVALRAQEELLQMLCGSRVVLHVELAHATPGVRVEPGVLEQVLVNLVGNAKDALGGVGQVWVRLHPGVEASGAPTAVLEVEDDGPGIPEHLRTQVFEPFFTTKPEGKGTGLGLASVQALAASQGGRVELVEGRPRGACFRVTFAGEA